MKRAGILLLFFAACSVADPGRDASVAERSLAIAKVTVTQKGDRIQSEAAVHFARYRGLAPESVPRLLGMNDPAALERGTCRAVDGTAALDEALGQAAQNGADIALLDAGRLELSRGEERAPMAQHAYPDVMPFVAGMVYGLSGAAVTPGQPLELSGEGGEDIGPFAVSVSAPAAFPHLAIASFAVGSDLELSWQPLDSVSDAALGIELKWGGRKGWHTVQCQAADDGHFRIPSHLLSRLVEGSPFVLVATRSARARLSAPGAALDGQFVVELRDVVQGRAP